MEQQSIPISTGDFPDKLKELREEQALSQKKLAEKAGISQQEISLLEKGQRDPSLKILLAIGAALGVLFLINAFCKKGGE